MTLFTSDGCSYMGMDEKTVQALRKEIGLETVFVTEETCRSSRESKNPVSSTPDPAIEKLKAVAKDPNAQPQDRLNAMAQLLGL